MRWSRAGCGPGIASMLLLVVLILAVALPATLIVPDLGDQVVAVVQMARDALDRLSPTPPAWVTDLPLVGSQCRAVVDADRATCAATSPR